SPFPSLLSLWNTVTHVLTSPPSGQPRHVRAARAHPQGPAALLVRAHRALPVVAELRRALLEPGENWLSLLPHNLEVSPRNFLSGEWLPIYNPPCSFRFSRLMT